jgi:hypothetical protein
MKKILINRVKRQYFEDENNDIKEGEYLINISIS